MSEFNLGDKPTSKKLSLKAAPETPQPQLQPQQENPPENQEANSTLPVGGNNPDVAALPDFDNAPLPDDENQVAAEPIGEGMAGQVTHSGFMSYDAFDQLFCTTFLISGHTTGLQTLVEAPSLPSRPDATRAMYDAILDTPSLHFIIKPSSIWMQRAFAMGVFFVPLAQGVAGEMRAKRRGNSSQPAQAENSPGQTDEQSMRAALKGKI